MAVGIAQIGIDDFAKVEMRVGQVKTAERIVGADKLLKLTVDIGTDIARFAQGLPNSMNLIHWLAARSSWSPTSHLANFVASNRTA